MKTKHDNRCVVRISSAELNEKDLYENLTAHKDDQLDQIDISEVMSCELIESGDPEQANFRINSISTKCNLLRN